MKVDEIVGALYDLLRDDPGDAFAKRAVLAAGIDTVEVLAIGRAVVDRAAEERRRVGYMHENDGAPELGRVEGAA